MFRRGWVAALAIGLLSVLGLPPQAAGAASTPAADEALLLTLTNTARAAAGVPALTLDGGLSSISRQWASSMAAAGSISHNPSAKSQIEAAGFNWRKTGENVGMGPALTLIHQALLNSPSHYRNIVDGEFQRVGIGVVYANSTVWVVQNFLTVGGASAPAVTAAPAVSAGAEPAATPVKAAPKPTTTVKPTTTTTTSTTTTTVAPAPTTTMVVEAPPAPAPTAGLPLALTTMVQQLRALSGR